MESVTHKIRANHNEMGPAEKKIADYIIANLNEITVISISELAEKCGCGDATVVRFSRRLGFEGLEHFPSVRNKPETVLYFHLQSSYPSLIHCNRDFKFCLRSTGNILVEI